VADVRRMNVGITRARNSLFIVGHLSSLMKNDEWKSLIEDGKERKAIRDFTKSNYEYNQNKIPLNIYSSAIKLNDDDSENREKEKEIKPIPLKRSLKDITYDKPVIKKGKLNEKEEKDEKKKSNEKSRRVIEKNEELISNSNKSENKFDKFNDDEHSSKKQKIENSRVKSPNLSKDKQKEKNNDPTYSSMRNVAGELEAAKTAIKYCVDNNVPELDLHYDYTGIKNWATGDWKTNKPGTIQYKQYYDDVKDKVKVNFEYVKAHSNNKYNDEADRLAKSAVGIYK